MAELSVDIVDAVVHHAPASTVPEGKSARQVDCWTLVKTVALNGNGTRWAGTTSLEVKRGVSVCHDPYHQYTDAGLQHVPWGYRPQEC